MTTYMRSVLTLSFALAVTSAFAQQHVTENISLSGHAHSYYMYNLNRPSGNQNDQRLYDKLNNQFGFSIFQFSLAYEDATTTGVLDINFGPAAGAVNASEFGVTSDAIQNAYVVQKVTDKFSFEIGKFGTHIGYEVIDATANSNYSTSYLFNYGPFYHVGARVRYQINETYSLMGAIYNNWDNLTDNNKAKTVGASFGFSPSESFSGSLNWIGGPEGTITPSGAISDFRQLFDVVLSYQLSSSFHFGFNGIYGMDIETWFGAAGYFTFAFNDNFSSTLRAEYFDDTSGIRGFGSSVTALTVSGNYTMKGGHVILRPEIKADFAGNTIFMDNLGNATKGSQTTVGLVALYRF